MGGDTWLRVWHTGHGTPRLRLVCLPFAGGGASTFRSWATLVPAEIEVCAVQLPGREDRIADPPLGSIDEIVAEVADRLEPGLETPIALFGHSMGALIAFEVARCLDARYAVTPAHVFVSGRPAPDTADIEANVHERSDDDVLDVLRSFNGTPSAVFDDPGLRELVLPAVRADLGACGSYEYENRGKLRCDLSAFGGTADAGVAVADLRRWQLYTLGKFRLRTFAGDHFFLRQAERELVAAILADLHPSGQIR